MCKHPGMFHENSSNPKALCWFSSSAFDFDTDCALLSPSPHHCSHLRSHPGQPWPWALFLEASSSTGESPHGAHGSAEKALEAVVLTLLSMSRDALHRLHPAPPAAPPAPALHRQSCQHPQSVHGSTQPGRGAEIRMGTPSQAPQTPGASQAG